MMHYNSDVEYFKSLKNQEMHTLNQFLKMNAIETKKN